MPSRSDLRKQFCSITRTSPEVATQYLEKSHWDVSRAAHVFFDTASALHRAPSLAPPNALVDLFNKYKDPENETTILIEGTLLYLDDLGIQPEDCRSLTLAFLLESPQTGEFPRETFLTFWTLHGISSLAEMRRLISAEHNRLVNTPSKFEEFYNYCFNFIRGSDLRIKSITHEDAVSYWTLLFAECTFLQSCAERLDQWYEFVTASKRPISRDTWVMFFKFLSEVVDKDPVLLSGYDEMSSWPSMVDEYIEWLCENSLIEPKDE